MFIYIYYIVYFFYFAKCYSIVLKFKISELSLGFKEIVFYNSYSTYSNSSYYLKIKSSLILLASSSYSSIF